MESPAGGRGGLSVATRVEWEGARACPDPAPSSPSAGEVAEYKNDLHSTDRKHQKNAVKRVIAAMTVGKDVSSLFPGE